MNRTLGDSRRIVDEYLDRLADHAIEDALTYLAPDFVLEFRGEGTRLSKTQTASALEWDFGAGGRLDWIVGEESLGSVTVHGSEGNDFLDLIGVGLLSFRSVYTIAPSGLIIRQLHEVSQGEVSIENGMAPLIAWAAEADPEELNELYPGEQMVYTGPMAVRWVRLAKEWQARTR